MPGCRSISKYCCVRCSGAPASVSEAANVDAVHRLLLDPVDVRRRRDPRDVEDRRRDVDDVGELRPEPPRRRWIRAGQWTTIGLRVPPRCEPTCLPHWNGVFAGPRPRRRVVRGRELRAPRLQPAVELERAASCISSVSGMPFCIVSSLNEPVSVPSMLAPLSPQIQMTTVLSSSPSSSIASITRPTLWSAFS